MASFSTAGAEFVYKRDVGLTICVYRPDPWLSWDETKALAEWLTERVKAKI